MIENSTANTVFVLLVHNIVIMLLVSSSNTKNVANIVLCVDAGEVFLYDCRFWSNSFHGGRRWLSSLLLRFLRYYLLATILCPFLWLHFGVHLFWDECAFSSGTRRSYLNLSRGYRILLDFLIVRICYNIFNFRVGFLCWKNFHH